MAGIQVTNGKAFEYALATAYGSYLQEKGIFLCMVEDNSYYNAQRCYNSLAFVERKRFDYCAALTIDTLVKEEDLDSSKKQYILFDGIYYPVTTIVSDEGFEQVVGTQKLQNKLLKKDGQYVSNEAKVVDEQIVYFVQTEDEFYCSKKKLLEEIYG